MATDQLLPISPNMASPEEEMQPELALCENPGPLMGSFLGQPIRQSTSDAMSDAPTVDDEMSLVNILWKEMEDLRLKNQEGERELARVTKNLENMKGLVAEAFMIELTQLGETVSSVVGTRCIPLIEANQLDQLRLLSRWVAAVEEKQIELLRKIDALLPTSCDDNDTSSLTEEVARTKLTEFANQVATRMNLVNVFMEGTRVEVEADDITENDGSPTDSQVSPDGGMHSSDPTVTNVALVTRNTQQVDESEGSETSNELPFVSHTSTDILESQGDTRQRSQRSAAVFARDNLKITTGVLTQWKRAEKADQRSRAASRARSKNSQEMRQ